MAVIDHITTNNSATYEIQDTVARTKSNNLESTNYTDIGGGGFADGNTLLVKTDNGMKKGFLNNFANWILDKLATKVYNQLTTSNKTMIGALNELNSKPSIKYKNGTFSPIYSTSLDTGTAQYDLSKYSPGSVLLIFYANGGMSIITIWGGSYSLTEIRKAENGVEISCDYSTKKMSVTVPEKAATILSIIQIK